MKLSGLSVLLFTCGLVMANEMHDITEAINAVDTTRLRELLDRHSKTTDLSAFFIEAISGHEPIDSLGLLSILMAYGGDIDRPHEKYTLDVGARRLPGSFRDWTALNCERVPMELRRFLLAVSKPREPVRRLDKVKDGIDIIRALIQMRSIACQAVTMSKSSLGDSYNSSWAVLATKADYLLSRWREEDWKPSPYDETVMSILSALQQGERIRDVLRLPTRNERFKAMSEKERYEADMAMNTEQEAIKALNFLAIDCEATNTARRDISVSIRTVHNGKTTGDWQVSWKHDMYKYNREVDYRLFETVSSPAKTILSPGLYEIILRKGDKVIGPFSAAFGGNAKRLDEHSLEISTPD